MHRLLAQSRRQDGQALVETALVIPVLLILAFGVIFVGRVTHATVAVQAAGREAGRTLATAPSEAEGLATGEERGGAVAAGYGLARDQFELLLDGGGFERGGMATARASYRVELADLPLLDRAAVTVSSTHQERIERYRSRETTEP
ncbi:MAG: TadE family protein [Dehalococcoidia bacterium]